MRMLCTYVGLDLTPSEANIFFGIEELFSRREDICKTFLKCNISNPKFRDIFVKIKHNHNVRNATHKYVENKTRTSRAYNNPVNYLKRLANKIF